MADPFLAEIRAFPYTFSPTGWALCNGQLMPISQNTALFALLGTTYGGDGRSTFALPDLMGSVPMHPRQGPGLSFRQLGEIGGVEVVTLLQSEIPAHAHSLRAAPDPGDNTVPAPPVSLAGSSGADAYVSGNPALTPMSPNAVGVAGGSLPHNNLMPYLTLRFHIALQGTFPQRP